MKNPVVKGLVISIAVTAASSILLPVVLRASRPLARAAGKTGLVLYEKGRETAAEIGEVLEDFIAEARAEFSSTTDAIAEGDEAMTDIGEEVTEIADEVRTAASKRTRRAS